MRAARNAEELAGLAERLKKLSYRAHFVAEDQAELKSALLHLVHLIVENISELVVDDQWLASQISVVQELVNQPLNLRQLDDVERRMKDVIIRQSSLKKSLNEAKDRLKLMLATFVDRLSDFSETTSGYHDTIEKCAERISEANDIGELSDVLDEVMREPQCHVNPDQAPPVRDELKRHARRVNDAGRGVCSPADRTSACQRLGARHDPLTGATPANL
ncbi:MAG: hypothetical protein IPM01_31610 [Burkholderiaceae bacterium]|nr:hypothetical protein [Burkholderiaceae bacterium]